MKYKIRNKNLIRNSKPAMIVKIDLENPEVLRLLRTNKKQYIRAIDNLKVKYSSRYNVLFIKSNLMDITIDDPKSRQIDINDIIKEEDFNE